MANFPNYCSKCGWKLETAQIEGRERAYCSHCDQPVYRNAKPCAGTIIVDQERVLLVKRTNPPAVGSWSLPAGFLEVDERPEDAASRELTEETGLTVTPADLELFGTHLVGHDDGIHVLVIIYRTGRATANGTVVAGSDAAEAKFWSVSDLLDSNETIEPGYESIVRGALAKD